MKKIVIAMIINLIFFTASTQFTYAIDSSSWIKDSFNATDSFINENATVPSGFGFINNLLDFFTNTIKAINYVLIVLLGVISIISISVTGVKYIMAADNPAKKGEARDRLHTVFKGMAFGFGAFFIWNISMAIVRVILTAFATS